MIRIELPSRSGGGPPGVYRLAERLVSADAPLPELVAFAAAGARRCPAKARVGPAAGRRQLVFRGRAELGRRRRDLECRWTRRGYDLQVGGVGRFAVARDGGRITVEEEARPRDGGELTETLLGPALILALALQDVWCLHAGAVEIEGRAVAFAGVSGAGKSTLARCLPELSPRFRLLADDVLPVTLAFGEPRVLPHFPQLKYGPAEQPGAAAAGSLPLAALLLLEAAPGGSGVHLEPLCGFAAALAAVRHTVSARLFTAELLARHIEFCARLAGSLPVRRLTYPREWTILPRVAETLGWLTRDGRSTCTTNRDSSSQLFS